jgi:hypothetical protein
VLSQGEHFDEGCASTICMHIVVEEDMVTGEDLNVGKATKLWHIFSAVRARGIDYLERNLKSRNQVLGIHMLLLLASCILGKVSVVLTGTTFIRN